MEDIFKYEVNRDDDFYAVLGCDELSTTEQINTEYKVRVRKLHPDKNPDVPKVSEEFTKLQRAKEVLTDEKQRADYDNWKRCGLAIPYDCWLAKKDAIHTSLHWAMKVKKEPAITGIQVEETEIPHFPGKIDFRYEDEWRPSCAGWGNRNENDIISKFRNYQI